MRSHLNNFDKIITVRTKVTGQNEGTWRFEYIKGAFEKDVIPFFKSLREYFETFDQGLFKEINEMKAVFNQMETEVDQCSVDRKYFEIEKKELLIENDRLLEQILSQDIVCIAMHSYDDLVDKYDGMKKSYVEAYNQCLELEAELIKKKYTQEKNTPYPSRKIRRICAYTHQRPRRKHDQYTVNMDDPNITMEEYIRLEEEKARRRGKVYNWETATYGKIWYDEDVHDLRSVETEFPAIVFNDSLTFEETPSCEPTVSPLNDNKIDFRISFDESDDEDYTVIYDKNSFSYKIIYVNDLKMDSENDNDKVNMPSFPSPEPMVSYFDDLDFFKDFENEFPVIVYNDALTSKLDFLTEPTISIQHIDEFNLKDETSLSECDEEEQNILYFNDLFPFNVIYSDDSKSDKDNDDDKIDIKQSLGGNVINTDVGAYAQGACRETTQNVFSNFLSSLSSQTVYTAYPNPMDTAYSLSGRYPVFIFRTVYTTYSYCVYMYQYGVSWGMDTTYRLPVQF
ncbi:hypothetical protein Tco_0852479 [Tanacetum coccineum]